MERLPLPARAVSAFPAFPSGTVSNTEEEFFILINVSIPGVWFCFTWPLRNQSFKAGRTLKHHLSNPLYDNREIEIWGR